MKTDIVIIGNTFAGYNLKHILANLHGISTAIISTNGAFKAKPINQPIYCGLKDNITRPIQTFGEKKALELYAEIQEKLEKAIALLRDLGVSHYLSDQLRWSFDMAEVQEIYDSLAFYEKCHWKPDFSRDKNGHCQLTLPKKSFWYDLEQLISKAGVDTEPDMISRDLDWRENSNSIEIFSHSKKVIECELLVVLDNHWAMSSFKPAQKCLYRIEEQFACLEADFHEPFFGFLRHSMIELSFGKQAIVSGAPYIPREHGVYSTATENHLLSTIQNRLEINKPRVLHKGLRETFKSCDDMPAIGPWPGHERVLVCFGLHDGIEKIPGFLEEILCSLLHEGRIQQSLELLLPKRFRSMS